MFGFIPAAEGGSILSQLCAFLREGITSGKLSPGIRLPPTRKVAQELRIARNIVIEVYEQLAAEGYLTSRVGSGTFIAEGIQVEAAPRLRSEPVPIPESALSSGSKENVIDFDAGTPDLRLFPRRLWHKYVKEIMDYGADVAFDYGDYQGIRVLREEIARYVYRVKGIRCNPDQILITSGTSEGLIMLASALSPLYRTAYVEDPTIGFVPDVLERLHYDIHPVPVDQHGMSLSRISPTDPAGLILLTPSHQYPTGSILSIQRRQQAVKLAEAAGHYIVEDDYDSEFRHNGGPVPPLQLLAPSRVIYAGTFSKTLSPALRIGFLIVPPPLLERVLQTKAGLNLTASGITQFALARFMADGHFDRHVHKMKAIYKKRRIFLVEQCQRRFGDQAQILGDEAGMHVQIAFGGARYANIDWQRSEAYGIRLSSLDDYARIKGRLPGKMVLGYGKLTEEEIGEGLRRLHAFVQSHTQP
ncbi:MocR-like pyridoxine biosynthesis transcription factor PdxR [Cohnella nanjingensis]|uniref:PLP-dependent aminotransferase family protein n=1 Tax=Cohnella nanjingensis TaxID=1387779 RepID=A0A7X0RPW3_9BACL|nr:PLP-dependent aminotransferase family protein [Cohnella nanjingensis]MBB6670230.1 PLP-dependent aminotransferase family protein [Cohnella nanjingensis]